MHGSQQRSVSAGCGQREGRHAGQSVYNVRWPCFDAGNSSGEAVDAAQGLGIWRAGALAHNANTPVVCCHHLLLGLALAERYERLYVLYTAERFCPHLQLTCRLQLLKARLKEQVERLWSSDVALLPRVPAHHVPMEGGGGAVAAAAQEHRQWEATHASATRCTHAPELGEQRTC